MFILLIIEKKKEVMCVCRYIYESYDMELRNDMDFFAIAKSLQNFNTLILKSYKSGLIWFSLVSLPPTAISLLC